MAQSNMNKMKYLRTHIGTIGDGIELINRFYWGIEIRSVNEKWYVKSGEKTIFEADSRAEVDVFLYGMALAYSIIPDKYVEKFREDFKLD